MLMCAWESLRTPCWAIARASICHMAFANFCIFIKILEIVKARYYSNGLAFREKIKVMKGNEVTINEWRTAAKKSYFDLSLVFSYDIANKFNATKKINSIDNRAVIFIEVTLNLI